MSIWPTVSYFNCFIGLSNAVFYEQKNFLCTIYYILHRYVVKFKLVCFLSLAEPPGPPTNVQVVSVTPTTVVLRWDPPLYTGGRDDVMYKLWYQPQGGSRELFNTVEDTMGNITGVQTQCSSSSSDTSSLGLLLVCGGTAV